MKFSHPLCHAHALRAGVRSGRKTRPREARGRGTSALISVLVAFISIAPITIAHAEPAFFKVHCAECHDAETKAGGLDLAALPMDLAQAENFSRWVKVHDRLAA